MIKMIKKTPIKIKANLKKLRKNLKKKLSQRSPKKISLNKRKN